MYYHSQLPPIQNRFALPDCSEEQNLILSLVAQGENVFFTGPAGVGNSFVLRKVRDVLKLSGQEEFQDFFITASTGNVHGEPTERKGSQLCKLEE